MKLKEILKLILENQLFVLRHYELSLETRQLIEKTEVALEITKDETKM